MLAPGKELKLYALLIFAQRLAMPDLDLARYGRWMFRRSVHHVFATFAILGVFSAPVPSANFAEFHNSSLRSRGRSAKRWPSAVEAASICLKRRLNFRLAFFSASSGSTPRNRAMLTAANRRSPSSSSTRGTPAAETASCAAAPKPGGVGRRDSR